MSGRTSKGCLTRLRCSVVRVAHNSRLARLWSSLKMKKVNQTSIIPRSTMVEDRLMQDGIDDSISDPFVELPVQKCIQKRPMWALFSRNGIYVVAAPTGSLAAMSEVRALLEYFVEYDRTRRLVVSHLWKKKEK